MVDNFTKAKVIWPYRPLFGSSRAISLVRATGAELQEIPQLIIIMKYGYNLPPGDSLEN